MNDASATTLPLLLEKAIHDAGLDLIDPAPDGGGAFVARISGTEAAAWLEPSSDGIWVAFSITNGERLGLRELGGRPLPPGMSTIGKVGTAVNLHHALHTVCVLQLNTPKRLSQEVEERLAAIIETERTQEVRTRIGQDVYREALFEL